MNPFIESRQFGRSDSREHARRLFQHRDFKAAFDRDGGDLEANIAAADDDKAAAGLQLRPQGLDVGNVAKVKNIAQIRARDPELTGAAAGSDDQLVVIERFAAIEQKPFAAAVDPIDADPEPHLDVGLLVSYGGLVDQRVGVDLARKIRLGQGRPQIWQMLFLAEEDNAPLESILPEQRRNFAACLAAADDCNCGCGIELRRM